MAYASSAARAARPQRAPRPSIRPLPSRPGAPDEGSAFTLRTLIAALVCVCAFFAVVGVARVWLNTQTVAQNLVHDELSESISQAQDLGGELEIQQTALANPSRVQPYAENNLGMYPASSYSYVSIDGQAAAVNADGSLSLAGSLDAIQSSGEGSDAAQTSGE